MFETYNMIEFGLCLRALRNSMRYTLEDVAYAAHINPETVRRIESGSVIPKYETLELLSDIYKTDILELLIQNRIAAKHYAFYTLLDHYIINLDSESLQSLQTQYDQIVESCEEVGLISQAEIQQFRLILLGIENYNATPTNPLCIEIFMNAMKITINSFSLNKFRNFKYNELETRILLLLAISKCAHYEYRCSNDLLLFCRDLLLVLENTKSVFFQMITKVDFNLSYNYHCLNDHKKALEYAEFGVKRCLKKDSNYLFAHLLIRKGIAMHFLCMDESITSIQSGLNLLFITGKSELAHKLFDILVKRYDFCAKELKYCFGKTQLQSCKHHEKSIHDILQDTQHTN